MHSKTNQKQTPAESEHVSKVAELPCAICEAQPVEVHEPNRANGGSAFRCALNVTEGGDGWHGTRQRWKLRKMDETNGDQQHNRGDIRMTEQQANDAIHLWAMYERFGAPDEPDYGDGLPAGHKAIGLESRYRSPQIWEAQEPRASADDIRAAHALVEGVYQAFRARRSAVSDALVFRGTRQQIRSDAQQRFKAGVMRP